MVLVRGGTVLSCLQRRGHLAKCLKPVTEFRKRIVETEIIMVGASHGSAELDQCMPSFRKLRRVFSRFTTPYPDQMRHVAQQPAASQPGTIGRWPLGRYTLSHLRNQHRKVHSGGDCERERSPEAAINLHQDRRTVWPELELNHGYSMPSQCLQQASPRAPQLNTRLDAYTQRAARTSGDRIAQAKMGKLGAHVTAARQSTVTGAGTRYELLDQNNFATTAQL